MSYLDPPPMPAPVVVMKDVGGLVRDYQNRTELYRSQNREVRLHECRSACTLALSLPNVCVYPSSLLKFHQAYNELTKEADMGVTNELWSSYPAPVRARLQYLTRQYKVLTGSDLIAMGFRNCNAPAEPQKIMIAKARNQTPSGDTNMFGGVAGALASLFPSDRASPNASPAREPPASQPVSHQPVSHQPVSQQPVSLQPLRPTAQEAAEGSKTPAPIPPTRPTNFGALEPLPAPPLPATTPSYQRPIPGSAPILEARFISLKSALRKLTLR